MFLMELTRRNVQPNAISQKKRVYTHQVWVENTNMASLKRFCSSQSLTDNGLLKIKSKIWLNA